MKTSLLLLTCLLVACSVRAVQGQFLEIDLDEDPSGQTARNMEVTQQLPGTCWICKWLLKKVKKETPNTSNRDAIQKNLLSACDKIGFLKKTCKNFVTNRLGMLIEELSTTDDVRTICVNLKACKPKDILDLSY